MGPRERCLSPNNPLVDYARELWHTVTGKSAGGPGEVLPLTSFRAALSPSLSIGMSATILCPPRMELPDGLCVPVPQLARLCLGLRLPFGLRYWCPHHHAREPTLLLGGKQIQAILFARRVCVCVVTSGGGGGGIGVTV